MRKIGRALAYVLVAIVLFFGLIMLASESGEVVVLSTADERGAIHETRLWVVEHDGALWLRAGVPSSAWLARLRRSPEVVVVRAGVRRRFRAIPSEDVAVRDAINARIAEKYGWAESLISVTRDGSSSIPVRLQTLD